MKTPFLRTAYNYDRNAAGDESGLACEDDSLTQQSFAEECDINTIVRRFGLSGELPTNVRMPLSSDFVETFDFHSAMDALVRARESFMEMPAQVRSRFHNDPGEFVAFCDDPENRAEALKLGLVAPKVAPAAPEPVLVKMAPVEPEVPPKGGK